jgi:hypothetical protein
MSCQPLAAIFTLQPPKKEIIPRQLGRSKLLRRLCFSPTTINNQQPLTKDRPELHREIIYKQCGSRQHYSRWALYPPYLLLQNVERMSQSEV